MCLHTVHLGIRAYKFNNVWLEHNVEYLVTYLYVNSNNATMGFLLSKSMDANFKKQQEFMLHNARLQVSQGAPTPITVQ